MILHAGDVGGDEVLDELGLIAPVFAVIGNCDDPNDARLSGHLARTVDGVRVHVSHGHELGVPSPAGLAAAYDADVVVYGHTHRPHIARVSGRWIVNPGAAGPRRFDILPSLARLTIVDGSAAIEIIELA